LRREAALGYDERVPDEGGKGGIERRRWERVLVDIEVDYGHEDTYVFAYIRDISVTGLFVRTHTPEPAHTRLNVRFTPTDAEQPLELEGEVIWVNPYRPGNPASLHPGMGIRFIDLDQNDRERLISFVKRFAYIDGPDGAEDAEPCAEPADIDSELN